MPARLDIALQRNEDWARTLYLKDDLGNPIDLTGWVIGMQVRDKLNTGFVVSATCDVVNASAGEIQILLQASQGTALGSYGNPIQTANLPYDVRATDPGGVHQALIAGSIILSRGETAL